MSTDSLTRTTIDTPVGRLALVAGDDGLRAVLWPDDRPGRVELPEQQPGTHPVLTEAVDQLREYFAGERSSFDLPLDLHGTDFQQSVWRSLASVAYGETVTYGALAAGLGRPTAARAVAAAVGRNPVSIILPCHRVVGADGSLTGFAGGLGAKKTLLELEGARSIDS